MTCSVSSTKSQRPGTARNRSHSVGTEVGALTAFGAGVVSFLSPCVLPLIPAYLTFITGLSLAELGSGERRTFDVLGPVLLFVAGFSLVFVASGASASVLGRVLSDHQELISRIAGAVILVLGIYLLDLVPMLWLRGLNVDPAAARKFGGGASFVLGLLFPFALGTCAGPVYGAILMLAADAGTVSTGALLLMAYAAGLAVPFVAVGLLFGRLSGSLRALQRHAKTINRVTGAVLALMGLAMVTGTFEKFATWLGSVINLGIG
ncbi:MAG: cytochrome c biogenesis protein CcdA [Actinobacteria bacterium]|nr:MAG: cytochrome c biogenesis protein CcdA [Actinomycetota bacterium]